MKDDNNNNNKNDLDAKLTNNSKERQGQSAKLDSMNSIREFDIINNNFEAPANILVVEDDKGLNKLIQKTLKRADFSTECAFTGAEAITKVVKSQNIMLLLDYVLPDTNGKKVIETLTKKKCSVPFIVMTGQGDEKIAVEMMKLGARDYIIKDRNLLEILPEVAKRVRNELAQEMKLRTTEKALRESEEKYSNLVEQATDGVIIVQDEVFKFTNSAMVNLIGYNVEEILGMQFLSIIAPDDKRLIEERNRLSMAGIKGSSFYEAKIQCKNNMIKDIELSVGVINYQGKPANMGIIRDVTKRKQMEEDLKRYTEHLEEEVKHRTNELIQSEKMSALGQLVAGVAHEVNNPLGYLKSNMELIKKDLLKLKGSREEKILDSELSDKFTRQVETSLKGINKIATIIRTLKRFSKPDFEGWNYSDINQGLKDTMVMVYNQLKHRIEVIEDYARLPETKCNIGQLNQVFMNLILNSSQAMDNGKIWLKTWSDDKSIFIEIKDNGSGITEDELKNIFDPFFTTKDMGTGLGLSISYRIIHDHGGDIFVDSKVGEGTKMTIKLPLEVRY